MLKDIEDVLLNIQLIQSKYKYKLVLETIINQKEKRLMKTYTIVKYHKEKIPVNGVNKLVRIEDDKVRGNLVSVYKYMINELKGFDGS